MAKTITKTYSVTVTFRYDTGEDITASDLNVAVGKLKSALRKLPELRKAISTHNREQFQKRKNKI